MPKQFRYSLVPLVLSLASCAVLEPQQVELPSDMATSSYSKPVPVWQSLGETEQVQEITRLLPDYVKDKKGWATDLYRAYTHLQIPQALTTYCATVAVVQQESSFRADPEVPGLSRIVRKELATRADKFFIPDALLNAALKRQSPDGRTWNQRIDALRTEKQLNELFEDMLDKLPFGQSWLEDFIPVKTAGPMQVSIAYAKDQAEQKSYPYTIERSLRNEVFTRRGGLYFGASILMDYPVSYSSPFYRFADFNAGRYASRNAAFQHAINQYTGQKLILDGDLLRYRGDKPSLYASNVETALRNIAGSLDLSKEDIREDLLLEKSMAFEDTRLYNRLYRLAEASKGKLLPREKVPSIRLKSPKITSKLTTSWFANKVNRRFNDCVSRYYANR